MVFIENDPQLIIPSRFQGRPQDIQQNYRSTKVIVVAFIYNPRWSNVIGDQPDGVTVFAWPDSMSRMFDLNLQELMAAVTQTEDCLAPIHS